MNNNKITLLTNKGSTPLLSMNCAHQCLHLCFLTYCLLISSFSHASNDEVSNIQSITISPHPYYPYYTDDVGMGIDIYDAAFATQGITIEYKYYPIKRAIYKMLNAEVDAFTPGTLFITDKKMREQLITVPSFIIQVGWLHKQHNNPKNLPALHGKVLATPQPAVKPGGKTPPGLEYLNPYIDKGMKYISVSEPERAIHMVLKDRVSFSAISALSGWHFALKSNPDLLTDLVFTTMRPPFVCNLAFSQQNPRAQYLAKSFEKGMAIIKANGTYVNILEKYWGKGNIPKEVLFDSLKHYGTSQFEKDKLIKAYTRLHSSI